MDATSIRIYSGSHGASCMYSLHSASAAQRTRYKSLLQVCGTLVIVAFHVRVPGARWGWIAVILFFALAGCNMAPAVDRSETWVAYGRSRLRRLAVHVAIIWCLVVLMALFGVGTPGAGWFLISSPIFLQNLTPPLFQYQFPEDWVFGPLWFVGALLQLQLILFAFRKALVRCPPLIVVGAVVVLGNAFRWITAVALGGNAAEVEERMGAVLYCLPLTHIEAITLGLLIGRGSLAGLGRHLPIVASLAIGASMLSAALSTPPSPIESLGLDLPLRSNYMHVWGYCALAFAAASLCSPHNPIAVRVESMAVAPWLDSALSKIDTLTYGAFVFHGAVMASTAQLVPWLRHNNVRPVSPILFLVTVAGAFLLARVTLAAIHASRGVLSQCSASMDRRQPQEKQPTSATS